MKETLLKLAEAKHLRYEEMQQAARELFAEDVTDSEIAAFLVALKAKGETAEELAGLASIMREVALDIPVTGDFMDNCGTGGDGSQSFNISTTAAFVLAGAGIKVAKHGNRSVSSKTGSADVLEALGVSLDATPERLAEQLESNGIAFLFAQRMHPRVKQIMKVRRDLRIPTIFNLIGPLTNPVPLKTQLLGIYREDMLETMALTLHRLGRKRAIVLHGANGMDEASLAGTNQLVLLDEGELIRFSLHPEEVGLKTAPLEAIRGGSAQENAAILLRVLGGEHGAYRDTVLLNAGIALFAANWAKTIEEGIALAADSIDSGRAMERLNQLRQMTREEAIG
ncbi:anthranilate phosphoribosyltransferase [Exiguobacterium sp. UBA5002]|uniref:anthranilate phosphoribosyltransferase n=1 Tax=Exiguobacterium sp. UBA5002 TaxID=1946497 RepID=UPI0025C3D5A4|nr:anthranilate phosphoribosyltransferase [Exiguobacterium sp. UBA5002]